MISASRATIPGRSRTRKRKYQGVSKSLLISGVDTLLATFLFSLDPNIIAHAQPTGLRKGTLFVTVDSSVWLSEIVRYRRKEILNRLQYSFGREFIVRISFRVG